MKDLPIKENIERLLQKERSGIWEIKDRNQYLKATSKLYHHPIRVPVSEYENLKDAVTNAVRCAKVYKKLIEIGIYHPKTEIVIFKDDKNYLSLMVTMPKLENLEYGSDASCLFEDKIRNLKSKLGLKETDWWDLEESLFNWGIDKESGNVYVYDLHICKLLNTDEMYREILKLAECMGIK